MADEDYIQLPGLIKDIDTKCFVFDPEVGILVNGFHLLV